MTTPPTIEASADTPLVSVDPQYYAIAGTKPAPEVQILGSRCADTGATFWPRRLQSPITGGAVSDVELAGTGTIWSWTYVNFPWMGEVAPSDNPGYGVCLVDLDDDGPRVTGLLIGVEGAFAVGDRVRATALPIRTENESLPSILSFEGISE